MRRSIVACVAASVPVLAYAQNAPSPEATPTTLEERLQRLEQRQTELEQQLHQKDAEIRQLKEQQARANAPARTAPAPATVSTPPPAVPVPVPPGPAPAAAGTPASAPSAPPASAAGTALAEETADLQEEPGPVTTAAGAPQPVYWGTYTENLGFKVANTDKGDMNVSLFTYVRYLNQKETDPTYTTAFGNTIPVQQTQSVQLLKLQIKFLGWLMTPRFRYFLYAWTSNSSMGRGAQVVLAGNLNYTFNRYLTLSGGIAALPGTRSLEGNFPYWLSNDNRMIADEFMRPSYTSGIWARGEILPSLRYETMLGNNLSQLGVNSGQLPNYLNTWSTALFWFPTTGEFGPGFTPGFGDFENHEQFATRLGTHYTTSTTTKQSQPNTDQFENTQIRLSDGTIIFTPNIFGSGVVVNQLQYQMADIDAGFKYHGYALEGEMFWRLLNDYQGPGTGIIPSMRDKGYQLQASAMAIPRTLQVYLSGARINGNYGSPYEIRGGINWFPLKNQVFRLNSQVQYIYHSPTGGGSVPYNVGSTGWIFYTDFLLAM